nr:immunoglobulin heavy chain junction region [Mus musculus]
CARAPRNYAMDFW